MIPLHINNDILIQRWKMHRVHWLFVHHELKKVIYWSQQRTWLNNEYTRWWHELYSSGILRKLNI